MPVSAFSSLPFHVSKTVTWIHIGDTHLTQTGEQNEIDLGAIVDEINRVYARGGVDFVFVPGDIADDGSVVAYEAFRRHMDRLNLPWCAIVGDHDVHEKNFDNFRRFVAQDLFGEFRIGPYQFIRLNAFSTPKPDSFIVDSEQLRWLKEALHRADAQEGSAVLLLHCYPSELKQGSSELIDLIHHHRVLLVDMGHTHYNELSNDGRTLYSATRSTGQIEEGPVGYSVTTLDNNTVSWHFVPLGAPSLIAITKPGDVRLLTALTGDPARPADIEVHAKTWSAQPVKQVMATMGDNRASLRSEDGIVWRGSIDASRMKDGTHKLEVEAHTDTGERFHSSVDFRMGDRAVRTYSKLDHENAIGAWEERGLLGSQLGPNKNGRKW